MVATYDPTLPTARDRLRHDLFDFDVSISSTGGIGNVVITAPGTGYTTAPAVVFTGGTPTTEATGHSVVDGNGVLAVIIDNAGAGYATLPAISFVGVGSGATASAEYATNALRPDVTYDSVLTLYGEDEARWRLATALLAQYGTDIDSITTDDGTHATWRTRTLAWTNIINTWAQFSGSLIRGRQRPLVGSILTTGVIANPGYGPFDGNDQRYRGSVYPARSWRDE